MIDNAGFAPLVRIATTGNHADCLSARPFDGATIQRPFELFNQPGIIERVQVVFVAYAQTDGDPFWEVMRE